MAGYAVIKLGGHTVFRENDLDADYVSTFLEGLKDVSKCYDGIVVVVGGGNPARRYISWGRALGLNESMLDEIGIRVARINAALLWAAYHRVLPPQLPQSLSDVASMVATWKVVFMGGLQPAQSTTTTALLVAEALAADSVVIATDVDGVYSEDPKKNPSAKRFDVITAAALTDLFGRDIEAGGYKLLDPLALAIIERSGLKVRVIKGRPPSNVFKALKGESIGTLVVSSRTSR